MDELLLSLAQSAWMPVVVILLTTIDGLFPPVPSEMIVVALAAVGAPEGLLNLVSLFVLAAVGVFCGDCLAFWVGRKVPLDRVPYLRRPKVRGSVRADSSRPQ